MRKFECKNCGTKFISEEDGQVECPNCHSDNVDYAKLHIPYKYIGVFVCLAIIVCFVAQINWNSIFPVSKEVSEENLVVVEDSDTIKQEIDSELIDLGVVIPPTIEGISNMELDKDNNYNFIIKISHAPKAGYWVVIADINTNEIVAKSNDGVFKGISFSKNDGKYNAYITNDTGDSSLSEKTEITGFKEVEIIDEKLSASELQNLINKQDDSLLGTDNAYISPVCKIKYDNLPKDSKCVPDNLADVFEMINFETWTSVEVTSLEYDDTKHISSITLKIKMPIHHNVNN